eukprot:CAMPEP_0197638674 /NCGR_PEP_ID=MMETSP1338-20131121/13546_1 /TAXON_ID=43686 ORGANISM="Pelagodinium beii, Strain RCC1491" /NCGR_SAMPLE_ID=MMETSP1338 /ASSEMBLY_ACC=CAM_ASM_000754 /LENGTH=119 /DNA_ID=CAMNT_0043211297 /DNA_START=68 /DNA_END=427 /DNA_ORIENTATION=-
MAGIAVVAYGGGVCCLGIAEVIGGSVMLGLGGSQHNTGLTIAGAVLLSYGLSMCAVPAVAWNAPKKDERRDAGATIGNFVEVTQFVSMLTLLLGPIGLLVGAVVTFRKPSPSRANDYLE